MTMPADLINGHYPDEEGEEQGEEYGGLSPLTNYNPEIHRGNGPADSESGGKWAYSRFLFQQAAMQQQLYGVFTMGHITEERELNLVHRLFQLFLVEWEAEATNREGRRREEETLAESWQREIAPMEEEEEDDDDEDDDEGDDDGRPLSVDQLVNEWNRCAAFMSQVYIRKRRHGLRHVEQYRQEYAESKKTMEETEFAASELSHAENQYFWCRIRQLRLMMDRTEDIALGIPVKDYTSVKQRLAEGISVHLLVTEMPWAYRVAYGRVFGSLADGELIRKHFAIMFTQQWPYEARPPSKKRRGFLGLGDRRDRRMPGRGREYGRRGRGGDGGYDDDDDDDE